MGSAGRPNMWQAAQTPLLARRGGERRDSRSRPPRRRRGARPSGTPRPPSSSRCSASASMPISPCAPISRSDKAGARMGPTSDLPSISWSMMTVRNRRGAGHALHPHRASTGSFSRAASPEPITDRSAPLSTRKRNGPWSLTRTSMNSRWRFCSASSSSPVISRLFVDGRRGDERGFGRRLGIRSATPVDSSPANARIRNNETPAMRYLAG